MTKDDAISFLVSLWSEKEIRLLENESGESLEEQLKAKWKDYLLWTVNKEIFKDELRKGSFKFPFSASTIKSLEELHFYLNNFEKEYLRTKPTKISKKPFFYFLYLFKNWNKFKNFSMFVHHSAQLTICISIFIGFCYLIFMEIYKAK